MRTGEAGLGYRHVRRLLHATAIAVAALAAFAPASPPAGLQPRYLLAVASCPPSDSCTERLFRSRDGVRLVPVTGIGAGEAPALVRRGSDLLLYDSLAAAPAGLAGRVRRFRLTAGRLVEAAPAAVTVTLANPADVQAGVLVGASAVADRNGAPTLVYALRFEPGSNACPVPGQACLKLRSATEVPRSGGAAFGGDAGNRLVLSLPASDTAVAPAIFAA